jgi:integrase
MMQERVRRRAKKAVGQIIAGTAVEPHLRPLLASNDPKTVVRLLALGVRLTDDHHVVAREDGQALQPRSLTHAFVKFARRHGVQIRLHDLRHSHATHMLASLRQSSFPKRR